MLKTVVNSHNFVETAKGQHVYRVSENLEHVFKVVYIIYLFNPFFVIDPDNVVYNLQK